MYVDLAVEQGRLGQLAGVRPHLDDPLRRDALRRARAQHQRLAPRRHRRPELVLRLRHARRRRAARARCRTRRSATPPAAPSARTARAAGRAAAAPAGAGAGRAAVARRCPTCCTPSSTAARSAGAGAGAPALRQRRQRRRGVPCLRPSCTSIASRIATRSRPASSWPAPGSARTTAPTTCGCSARTAFIATSPAAATTPRRRCGSPWSTSRASRRCESPCATRAAAPCDVQVTTNAYGSEAPTLHHLEPGGEASIARPLAASRGWYDLSLARPVAPGYRPPPRRPARDRRAVDHRPGDARAGDRRAGRSARLAPVRSSAPARRTISGPPSWPALFAAFAATTFFAAGLFAAVFAAAFLPTGPFAAGPGCAAAAAATAATTPPIEPPAPFLAASLRSGRGSNSNETLPSFGVPGQAGLELAPRLVGDEALEQVGLAGGEQLGHLLARDRLLQDDLAALEVAGDVGADRVLADVVGAELVDVALRLRALAEALLLGEIDRLARSPSRLRVFAEIELELPVLDLVVEARA